tara:strand:- start:301 stop:738 length:438 start_codon:yes stop_codon:yes gene_type:complete
MENNTVTIAQIAETALFILTFRQAIERVDDMLDIPDAEARDQVVISRMSALMGFDVADEFIEELMRHSQTDVMEFWCDKAVGVLRTQAGFKDYPFPLWALYYEGKYYCLLQTEVKLWAKGIGVDTPDLAKYDVLTSPGYTIARLQ